MESWLLPAGVSFVLLTDLAFTWMHRRGWVYYSGLCALAERVLVARRRVLVHREGEVVLLSVAGLPPERYPERLAAWKREHPRLRVTGLDDLVQRDGELCLVLLATEQGQPVTQEFAWHALPRGADLTEAPRVLARELADRLRSSNAGPFTVVSTPAGGAWGLVTCATRVERS